MQAQDKTSRAVVGFRRFMYWTGLFGAALVFASMLMIVVDTGLRYLFNAPIAAVDEVITYVFLVYITLIPAGWILMDDAHVRVDVLVNLLDKRKKRAIYLVGDILSLACSAVLVWQGWLMAWGARGANFTTSSALPEFPAYLAIPIGGFFLLSALVVRIVTYRQSAPTASGPLSPQ